MYCFYQYTLGCWFTAAMRNCESINIMALQHTSSPYTHLLTCMSFFKTSGLMRASCIMHGLSSRAASMIIDHLRLLSSWYWLPQDFVSSLYLLEFVVLRPEFFCSRETSSSSCFTNCGFRKISNYYFVLYTLLSSSISIQVKYIASEFDYWWFIINLWLGYR